MRKLIQGQYRVILLFSFVSIFLFSSSTSIIFEQNLKKIVVTTSIKKALKNPQDVIILDLRGKGLTDFPKEIIQLENLEILLMGMKNKNFLFVPQAWPYILGIRRLPAGGFAHLERGKGKCIYHKSNEINEVPIELTKLKKLQLVDLGENPVDTNGVRMLINSMPNTVFLTRVYEGAEKERTNRDRAIELRNKYDLWN